MNIRKFAQTLLFGIAVAGCTATAPSTEAATSADRVLVDKSERTMWLYKDNKVVAQFHVALGDRPVGHKQQEGDERTPEGHYVLDYRKADSAYFRSIHISYPNSADRANAKRRGVDPGGLIMIHGQKNGYGHLAGLTQRRDWTDGCLALTNEDMLKVWNLVKVPTPIEIRP